MSDTINYNDLEKEFSIPDESTTVDSLDKFIETSQPFGSIEKAIGNTLYGINHRKIKGVLPENKDDQGYTFFTRPQLNLSTDNIRNYRHFYSLLTQKDDSIHRYVRCMLDPKLMYNSVSSSLMDNDSAFIPVLTNTLKTISGWPDVVNSSFTSKSGVRKEQFSMVDGTVDIFESFDLDITFNNMKEEPLTLMFDTWLHYMSTVFEGVLTPYTSFITENELDYNTRIYRVVLTENKKFVKKIAATGASYPINIPTGKFFDANDERPFSDQTKDVTIRFKSLGAMYNDDILIKEFNDTGGIFNKSLRMLNAAKPGPGITKFAGLQKIPANLLSKLNYRGYPRIDPVTFEMQWWANEEDVKYINKKLNINILEG